MLLGYILGDFHCIVLVCKARSTVSKICLKKTNKWINSQKELTQNFRINDKEDADKDCFVFFSFM